MESGSTPGGTATTAKRLGGIARALSLSGERRSGISRLAALRRHENARHKTCAIPRLRLARRARRSDTDTDLRIPVFAVDGIGVSRDLLRWLLVQDDAAAPEFSRGDVLVLALAPAPRPGAVQAVLADGGVALGRVSGEGGARLFEPAGGRAAPVPLAGEVVGHVVARLGAL